MSITLLRDLRHGQLWQIATSLWLLNLGGQRLRRASQFVLVVLLITSLGAPATIYCRHCVKETAEQKTAPSSPHHCPHRMSPVALGRTLEAVTRRVACHACSRISRPSSAAVVPHDRTPDRLLTDGERSVAEAGLVAALPRLPESPPPLTSNSKQAVICIFLI